jgi:hypothetical protein
MQTKRAIFLKTSMLIDSKIADAVLLQGFAYFHIPNNKKVCHYLVKTVGTDLQVSI